MEKWDIHQNRLEIEESDSNLNTWISKPFVGNELRQQLRQANVLLVPQTGYFTDQETLNFPKGTEEFFLFLKEHSESKLCVDICVEDDDFTTLIQHADILTIASIVMTVVVAPITINLISDFIIQRLKRRYDDGRVISEITIYDEAAGKSFKCYYNGPATAYREVMNKAVMQICENSTSPSVRVIVDGNPDK